MSEGMIILLVAGIGVMYFLYQRFRPYAQNADGRQHQQITVPSRTPQANVPAVTAVARNTPNHVRNTALGDNTMETGPMIYFANERYGRNDKEYRFNYKKVGGTWRAYILRMPSLGGRDTGSAVIHRLQDNGGYYICWDREVNTLKDMQNISRHWADSIQEYIHTGRFGNAG